MVVLFHRWYIVLHFIGCGRLSMKILFVVVLSSCGNAICGAIEIDSAL